MGPYARQQHRASDLICFSRSSPSAVYTSESRSTKWIRLPVLYKCVAFSSNTFYEASLNPSIHLHLSHIIFLLDHSDELSGHTAAQAFEVSLLWLLPLFTVTTHMLSVSFASYSDASSHVLDCNSCLSWWWCHQREAPQSVEAVWPESGLHL